VRFPAERKISRFVVIAYEDEGSTEKAPKWGVTDYEIQSWDAAAGAWRKAVEEKRGRAMAIRVHPLAEAIRADRIRIVVTGVAPLDGVARLLQFEAWGPGGE
jgi:hypothetical protein